MATESNNNARMIVRIAILVVGLGLGAWFLWWASSLVTQYLMTLAAVFIILLIWVIMRVAFVSMETKPERPKS